MEMLIERFVIANNPKKEKKREKKTSSITDKVVFL